MNEPEYRPVFIDRVQMMNPEQRKKQNNRMGIAAVCNILFSMSLAVMFGIFAYDNPDLISNNQVHCYAIHGHQKSVPASTPSATDVTAQFLSFFRLQFHI